MTWAFLDVGNVLVDEDRLTFFVLDRHVEAARRANPATEFGAVLAEYEARAVSGSRWPLYEVMTSLLDPAALATTWTRIDREARARYADLCPPIEAAAGLVDRLGRRSRLGLIANQPREARGVLAARGLLDRFEVIALSEEEGLYKPDPALFRRAIDRAGASPSQCLMIGDRPDHDLVPARSIGMATALVRWPDRSRKGWRPETYEGLAYLASLARIAASRALRAKAPPTWEADDLEGLADAIEAGV